MKKERIQKLTILHANDFHGRISFKTEPDFTLVGGISLLSSYIKKVRAEEPSVFAPSAETFSKTIFRIPAARGSTPCS